MNEQDKIDDEEEFHFLQSEEFKESLRKQVINDTWGNDLPMIYGNAKGEIVKHYKDGTIEIIGHIKK